MGALGWCGVLISAISRDLARRLHLGVVGRDLGHNVIMVRARGLTQRGPEGRAGDVLVGSACT